MKAHNSKDVKNFTDIPNIGKSMTEDFNLLGIRKPQDLAKQDPLKLYRKLEKLTGGKQDPCVLDTFMAAVDFMKGGKALPWWHYTASRKKLLGKTSSK
jgi:hypothetical protein